MNSEEVSGQVVDIFKSLTQYKRKTWKGKMIKNMLKGRK
jgi:hypothetical protein